MPDTPQAAGASESPAAAPAFSICVYCGSRAGAEPAYPKAADAVGRWIGSHGGQLVYGGGNNGLMGRVADATLASGGRVVGIIPQALMEREWAKTDCTELHVVATMHDRKRMMAERADAFLALPGGVGTLEELFEVWAWRQLGYHDKPIGLLDTAAYWQPLWQLMQHTVAKGFVGEAQLGLVRLHADADVLLSGLVQDAGLTSNLRDPRLL
ncbi:MAG: TIGR00730 family Rossman fold protein [Burkholderiaceae bacterium]